MSNKQSTIRVLTIALFVIISVTLTNWIVIGGETALALRFFSPLDTPEPPPPPPDTPTPSIPTVTALGNINIRSGPGIEYDVVGLMREGDSAVIVGTTAVRWWKIECPINATGLECWVSGLPQHSTAKNTESVPWVSIPPTPSPIAATATPVPPTQAATAIPVPPTQAPPATSSAPTISDSPTSEPDGITNDQISINETVTSESTAPVQIVTQEASQNTFPQPTETQTTIPKIYYWSCWSALCARSAKGETQAITPETYYWSVTFIAVSFLVLGLAIGLILRRKG